MAVVDHIFLSSVVVLVVVPGTVMDVTDGGYVVEGGILKVLDW